MYGITVFKNIFIRFKVAYKCTVNKIKQGLPQFYCRNVSGVFWQEPWLLNFLYSLNVDISENHERSKKFL